MPTFPAKTTFVNGDIYTAADVNLYGTAINDLYNQSPVSLVVAKGDLLVGSAAATVVKKTVGANDTLLVADSAAAGGVKWVTLPAAGVADNTLPLAKVVNGTAANIPLYNASGVLTSTAVTGDVTISNAGVTSIGTGVIVKADLSTASGEIAGTWATATVTLGNITPGGATSVARALTIGKTYYFHWYLTGGTPTAAAAVATTLTITGVTFAAGNQCAVYTGPLGIPAFAKVTPSSNVITIYSGMNQTNYGAGAAIGDIALQAVFELA